VLPPAWVGFASGDFALTVLDLDHENPVRPDHHAVEFALDTATGHTQPIEQAVAAAEFREAAGGGERHAKCPLFSAGLLDQPLPAPPQGRDRHDGTQGRERVQRDGCPDAGDRDDSYRGRAEKGFAPPRAGAEVAQVCRGRAFQVTRIRVAQGDRR
jgi:hypothetical protein